MTVAYTEEIQRMTGCYDQLKKLDRPAQLRVLKWLIDRTQQDAEASTTEPGASPDET